MDIHLLNELPPVWPESQLRRIQQELSRSTYKIVILDDDPTGTQTTCDLPVLTHWSVKALEEEITGEYPAFFILTNSRALTEPDACALAREIGVNLKSASDNTGIRTVLISRSDSTLRGHFPGEVDAMAEVMGKKGLPYLILPCFLEGGRYTVDDIHYVQDGDRFIPAADTPFARDAVFGFANSDLRDWVEEKTRGIIKRGEVTSITLSDIRMGGPARVSELLHNVPQSTACIVNIADYRDMEVLVAALIEVEKCGKEFLYRTAASFVRTRTGLEESSGMLSRDQLITDSDCGGLFVIGSYVEKTGLQVKELLQNTDIVAIKLQVEKLLDDQMRQIEIERVVAETEEGLKNGRDCAVYTSRRLITGSDDVENLTIGSTVSDSLIAIVKSLTVQPRYLVAKGGITSSDTATKGLGVKRAMILGQALAGVPVWQLGPEAKYPGMSYVVFPGNVGGSDALVEIKNRLA